MKERDELWDMLGEAPMEEAPAWFATKTLARVRRESKPVSLWSHLLKRWTWAVGLAVVVTCVGVIGWNYQHSQEMAKTHEALEFIASLETSETESWYATSY